jgi:hypothetical protein
MPTSGDILLAAESCGVKTPRAPGTGTPETRSPNCTVHRHRPPHPPSPVYINWALLLQGGGGGVKKKLMKAKCICRSPKKSSYLLCFIFVLFFRDKKIAETFPQQPKKALTYLLTYVSLPPPAPPAPRRPPLAVVQGAPKGKNKRRTYLPWYLFFCDVLRF